MHGRRFNCPWKKSYTTFIHFENLRLSRVLCTRDRLVRSGRQSTHSLSRKRRRQRFNAGALGSVPWANSGGCGRPGTLAGLERRPNAWRRLAGCVSMRL